MSSYQFQVKHFGWVSQPSFWQQNQLWQAKQANLSDAISAGSGAADAFSNAAANLGAGMDVIAAQRAVKRLGISTSGTTSASSTGSLVNTTA